MFQKIVDKLLSARFLIAIMIASALCWGFIHGKIGTDAFVPIALLVFQWYFERKDRKEKENV